VTPLFSFGHGLSYTTFSYTDLVLTRRLDNPALLIDINVMLTNLGDVAGSEVPQLYLGFPDTAVGEPPKQLKMFLKVDFTPHQQHKIRFWLTPRDISTWDSDAHAWKRHSGWFNIMVGASSSDIRVSEKIML
jgi:beta-glucosidase